MKSDAAIKLVIDRIEGDLAVLVLSDNDQIRFNLPVTLLPKAISEGDHLQMTLSKDEQSTEAQRNRVDDLLKKLKKS
jgi:hypothetical protein